MSREARIGVFVGAALLVLAVFIFVVGDLSVLFHKRGYGLALTFDSAAGLDKRAAVKMAGVPIGYVKGIELAGRKARVLLAIYAGVEVPKDSRATFNSVGLLGEKYIEILPGAGAEFCADGDTLPGFPSMSFDQVGPLLASLGDEIKAAVSALRGTLDEETRAGVKSALAGAAGAAEELRAFLAANRAEMSRAADGAARTFATAEKTLAEAAADFERTMALLRDTVQENREALRTDLRKIGDLAGRIEESTKLLNAALEKINRGEGTAGRLLHDPALYDQARSALQSVETTTQKLSSAKASLDIQADYYGKSGLLRSSVEADLRLTPRAFLGGGLVRDPREEAFHFSLLGGYRFGSFAPYVGFIESEFGAGVDYFGRDNRWRLSLEGFDWNREESPRFRFAARVLPLPYLYVTAGIDDFTLTRRREVFFGLGLVLR